jgi:hypothetical protein
VRYIFNLTRHAITPEQAADGAIDLTPDSYLELVDLLMADPTSNYVELIRRADRIAEICSIESLRFCGDVSFAASIYQYASLSSVLISALKERGIAPLKANYARFSVEKTAGDGSLVEFPEWKHVGWTEL